MQGWGGSCRVGTLCRGGVGHVVVGRVMQGWGGSCRGGMGHAGVGALCRVGWVM